MYVADLHIHSKYSRATSPKMNLTELAQAAKVKGIDVLGTGDFTHPVWMKELKAKLKEGNGFYDYAGTSFALSVEISLIYKKNSRQRRIHYIILAPDFGAADQINEYLDKKGRRDYDGRPIFGMDSIELIEQLMSISKKIELIPAHAWTSWYGIFGSMSGFDSVEECFEEKTKHIHAIETGMSSDPAMNWRISSLDKFTLISNSDSHSPYPWRLGREANVFSAKRSYDSMIRSIRTKKGFEYTIETYPEYGKYHIDGHRSCNFSCEPDKTKKLKSTCPNCRKPLTVGVLSRVNQLADREEGYKPKDHVPFKSVVPLHEIISSVIGSPLFSKKTYAIADALLNRFGSELNVLLNTDKKDLMKIVNEKIANTLIKNRTNELSFEPGYDGVYGKIKKEGQSGLGKFLK